MQFKMIHENYNVADLAKSMAFYEEALGLKETRRKEAADGSFIIVYLANENSDFELELTCPTLPRRKCSKPCDTWPRACFFENNYIPTVYSFISVLIFRKSPLV